MNHEETFTYIYDNKVWGEGSGGGSNPENNTEYIQFLQEFLKEKGIKSVIDFGCGDWQFSQFIDWSGIDYYGIDCVESVIIDNISKFKKDGVNFFNMSEIVGYKADLLILKDVLQHWTNESIIKFLNNVLSKFTYILITNSKGSENYQHPEVKSIITRPISADSYPLNGYPITILKLLDQNPNDIKEISLIQKVV